VDSVTAERLKSLGYVSGRVELGAAAGADPKTQIAGYVDYVQQFTRGVDALQAGQQREAERVFERLVRVFPGSYEVHQYLGRTRAAGGRHDDALREFETARRLSPGSALVAFDAAKSLAAKRDFAAALARVTEGLTLEPDTFYGYVTKGQVLRAAGQRPEAQAAFEKALPSAPASPSPSTSSAPWPKGAGDPAAAASHYQRALTSDAGMVEARAALSRVERQRPRGVDDERPQTTNRGAAGRRQTVSRAMGWRSGDCGDRRGRRVARVPDVAGDRRRPASASDGCQRRASRDLNVLLVTLDTTRADRLGAYGFKAIETPALDRIAREGVLFEHAVAPAPLTLPAHSSLFTSKLPPAPRGARQRRLLPQRARDDDGRAPQESGDSGRVASSAHTCWTTKWGIAQGFEKYFDDFDLSKYRTSPQQRRATRRRSRGPCARVARNRALVEVLRVGPLLRRAFALRSARAVQVPLLRSSVRRRNRLRRLAGRPLMTWLETNQLLEKTIVVVMGDHGESLGDHGEGTHGFFVYESVLHVPLLIRAPYDAMRGRRSQTSSGASTCSRRCSTSWGFDRPRRSRARA
jgi:Flp pilus assembly protein TadD